ncbi:helix-turn-helix domain-containing protein [Propionivibrio sp.]|uniref:helix-turn-helix domain-containing protein n=1 Tax=Propionivibrio sp. TaxID=2212460 RepID=UPI0026050F6C|nr:helix-turn-helix domain-containing protein [Propionivibrio sp.]
MNCLQAYKYELQPNGDQQRNTRRFVGSCRFVFNKALAMQKARYEQGEKKLGWIRYRNSRDILGTAQNITVSCNGGKWFVSIQTEREIAEPVHPSASIIGIDVGCSYENNADLVGAMRLSRGLLV